MVNYDDLPLFPLHLVLYPEMPLPLHIFEPRYREMLLRCREENSPFGVVLIQNGEEVGEAPIPHAVGTTARLEQFEELPDGRMDIVVVGDTRFRITETRTDKPYLTGKVEPFWEQITDPIQLKSSFDTVVGLFKSYLKSLLALTNRPLSAVHLPQEPEYLSYAIAHVLQISLHDKQKMLEMTTTEARLRREIEILGQEIETQKSLNAVKNEVRSGTGIILPVDTQQLSKFSSPN